MGALRRAWKNVTSVNLLKVYHKIKTGVFMKFKNTKILKSKESKNKFCYDDYGKILSLYMVGSATKLTQGWGSGMVENMSMRPIRK